MRGPGVVAAPAAEATELFAFDEGECRDLARRFGTPCFVYRAERARARLAALRAALPGVRIAFAVKANPHRGLLGVFAAAGAAFDCASVGELRRLAALGVGAERLSFAGPGKRDAEIDWAVARGVRLQAEGEEDLARVDAAAARLGIQRVEVNVRIQPAGLSGPGGFGGPLGGGGPSAFGVDEEDLAALLEFARSLGRVTIVGLHGAAATNERDAGRLLVLHERLFAVARRLRVEFGIEVGQIDLGGGLGVPYAADDPALDLGRLGRGLAELRVRHRWFRGELVLEPGRFLAASCGVYLARVVRTKTSRGERFAVLEGGIHHLLRPALTGEPFPVRACDVPGVPRPTTLAGPLCTGLDRLGRVALPPLAAGDLVCFGSTGAYGATEAMSRFLSHPPAREICLEEHELRPR